MVSEAAKFSRSICPLKSSSVLEAPGPAVDRPLGRCCFILVEAILNGSFFLGDVLPQAYEYIHAYTDVCSRS